ncbi:MAG: hypothetical protein LQ338_007030, partial [Usnochroma carphineum]
DVRGNVGTRLRKLDDPAYGFDCLILAGAGIERLGLGHRVGEWLGPDTDTAIDGGEGKGEEGGDTEKKEAMMLHAVGQGAIGLEIREGDDWLHGLLGGTDGNKGVVVNRASWECQAERSLLRTLEGGCSVPVGVFCSWEPPPLPSSSPQPAMTQLSATSAEPDGSNEARILEANSISTTPAMQPGILHMLASVTSVDGTECVAASREQWVGSDEEADEAGWELARVLVERGAEKILKEIGLNRGMVERGDGA